ncbi:hypothetical protein [Polaromonas sp. AET17H-212]|nr:hypothetical protein [Polaromonas sp. AET17H-212]
MLDQLQQIMVLPNEQRIALMSAWSAIDPAVAFAGRAMPAEEVIVEEPGADTLANWLEAIGDLPKRQRYALMEDALGRETSLGEREAIHVAMSNLTNSDPLFAIEVSVTKYAYEHPVLICLGAFGLILLTWATVKGAWRIVF